MKKQLFLSLALYSCLFADTFINPLPNSVKSIDNGGTKSAIDVYKDGIGAELMDKPGVATDNSAMNTLVYKYGEEAKTNNVTIVDQVINGNSNPTAADVVLAGRLTIDGAACNDGNIDTNGETWLNGVCQGGFIPDGTSCSDNNSATENDKYINQVCVGGIVSYYNAKILYLNNICAITTSSYCGTSSPISYYNGIRVCPFTITPNYSRVSGSECDYISAGCNENCKYGQSNCYSTCTTNGTLRNVSLKTGYQCNSGDTLIGTQCKKITF